MGRVALGAAILAAPERVTARWLGAANASQPVAADLARGLATRDIALGLASLSTLEHPAICARLQAGCALADMGDVLGTLLARRHLPRAGMLATVAVAAGTAAVELVLARSLAGA